MKIRILLLCTGNSCRSQMAEGLVKHYLESYFEVHSAGTFPKEVNQNAVKVLAEIGIDGSALKSKSVDTFRSMDFDLVITLCDEAKESCPVFPGRTEIVHISFEDPADATGEIEEILNSFREVRDDIKIRLLRFLREKYSIDQEL